MSQSLRSSAWGATISIRDFVYLKHLELGKREELLALPPMERFTAFFDYFPDTSPLRDCEFIRLFSHSLEELSSEAQLRLTNAFDDDSRALSFRNRIHAQRAGECVSLDERISFITALYPSPCPQRDDALNGALDAFPFSVKEFRTLRTLFSEELRFGVKPKHNSYSPTSLLLSQLKTPREKRHFAEWLLKLRDDLPETILHVQRRSGVEIGELRKLTADRHQIRPVLDSLFLGEAGLFTPAGSEDLARFCDRMFRSVMRNSATDQSSTQLGTAARLALGALFSISDQSKKCEILQGLIAEFSGESRPSLDEFATALCRSWKRLGFKAAQVIASQVEVQRSYPNLAEQLAEMKENADPMTPFELMEVVLKDPYLSSKPDFTIQKRIGSASIKGVFLADLDGEECVLKARRLAADKGLEREKKSLNEVYDYLERELPHHFPNVRLPRYTTRVLRWLREELDFRREAGNSERLLSIIAPLSMDSAVPITVPRVRYFTRCLILEDRAPGVSLDKAAKQSADIVMEKVGVLLQRSFFAQLQNRFFHCDPHGANIFVEKIGDSLRSLSFIDTGLMGTITNLSDAKLLGRLAVAGLPGMNRSAIYRWALLGSVQNDLLDQSGDEYAKLLSDLPALPPKLRPLRVLNFLDTLPGYEVSDSLTRLLNAASKNESLWTFRISNTLPLLRVMTELRRRGRDYTE